MSQPTPNPDSRPVATNPFATRPLRDLIRSSAASSLESLAQFLPPADRALVVGYLARSQPTRELAALVGTSPKSARLRLRRLIARLSSPSFKLVAIHHHKWPRPRRDVAIAIFLHGLGIKATASLLNLPRNRVIELREATRAVIDQLSNR